MPRSVLIVDDEPRITFALMTRLESCGFEVFHAINGLAGVEAAALHEPDAIILDVRMPDIDGFDACRRIKRINRLRDIPVIFLSANPQDESKQHASAAGGAAFISKPYEAAEVIRVLDQLTHTDQQQTA